MKVVSYLLCLGLSPADSVLSAIRADSIDPDASMNAAFSNRLKQMGIVQPNPTFSPSSTADAGPSMSQSIPGPSYPSVASNTTLSVLEARRRLQDEADSEFAQTGGAADRGREFLDVGTIRNVLVLRAKGMDPAEIESRLRLKPDVVKRLGPAGVVAAA